MDITLEALGITRDEITQRIVDKAAESLLSEARIDEDGEGYSHKTSLGQHLSKLIQEQIKSSIEAAANRAVLPQVRQLIDGAIVETTNCYGERKKDPQTLTEYIVKRVDQWLDEPVNKDGKTQRESSYSFEKWGSRIRFIVSQQVGLVLDAVVKERNKSIHDAIAEALAVTVRDKLRAIEAALAK